MNAVQPVQNQEIKAVADIEVRNRNKLEVKSLNVEQKAGQVLNNREKFEQTKNNWKNKTCSQPGYVNVKSVYGEETAICRTPRDEKIQAIMRQISGQ